MKKSSKSLSKEKEILENSFKQLESEKEDLQKKFTELSEEHEALNEDRRTLWNDCNHAYQSYEESRTREMKLSVEIRTLKAENKRLVEKLLKVETDTSLRG